MKNNYIILGLVVFVVIIYFFVKNGNDQENENNISRQISNIKTKQTTSGKHSIKHIGLEHKHQHDHNHGNQKDVHQFEVMDNGENFIFSNSKVGKMLEAHISRLEDVGPDAQRLLDERLNDLRENKKIAGEELRSAYSKLNINHFSERHKIIWTLGEIKDPDSLEFLTEIAVLPIPDSILPYKGHGDKDRPMLEATIRMEAISSMADLGFEMGEQESTKENLLLAITSTNDISVRKVAIVTYIKHSENQDEAMDYLKSILPEEDHRLISNKVDDIPELD